MRLCKGLSAGRVGGVEQRAVGKDNPHRPYRVVTVVLDAVARSAGVVCQDTANLRRIDRCRFRPDLPVVTLQHPVGRCSGKAYTECGGFPVVGDGRKSKSLTALHQDGIGDGLSTQAGTCRLEGDWDILPAAELHQPDNLRFAVDFDYSPGNQSIQSGIAPFAQPG